MNNKNKPLGFTRSTHKTPFMFAFCAFAVFMLFASTVLNISFVINNPKIPTTQIIVKTPAPTLPKARSGAVSISSVHTTDANQIRKTVFARGDTIDYTVDIDNTMSREPSVDLLYKVFVIDHNEFVKTHFYNFNSTRHIAAMPLNSSSYDLLVSIPLSAAPATYAIQVTTESSNNAFLPSSDSSHFTVQPPTQLGPFKIGNFTRNDGNDQGSSQITLYYNGEYIFQGCFQNSSLLPVSDTFIWEIASASRVIYQFVHTGGMTSILQFWKSHQDCWKISGINSAIAADWIPLTTGATIQWAGDVNTDLGPLLNGFWQFLTKVAAPVAWKVIQVIWNQVSLALEDGAGGALADGAAAA